MKGRFSRYLAHLHPIMAASSLPCFYGCGCTLPAGDDDTSRATRRAHLEACPVAIQKAGLKARASNLIAQNPAHARPEGA